MVQAASFAAYGVNFPPTPWANLPPAASESGSMFYCSDAPGGASMVLSDGSAWRQFARGMQSFIATTDASGNATWTFSTAFPAAPVVNYMIENTASQPMVSEITALSASAVTIRLKQAQTLPSVLTLISQLIGFNVFGGSAISGVKVHLRASPATQ